MAKLRIIGKSYYADFRDQNGERQRIPIGKVAEISKTEANKAVKSLVGDVVQGRFNLERKKKPIPFKKLCDEYMEWAKVSHRSYWRDEVVIKFAFRSFEGKPLSQITSWDIEHYKKERREQDRKPETINRELTVLKRMFNLAIQWNLIKNNPVKGVKFMEVPKPFYRVLGDDEFERLYNASSPEFKPLLLCAYLTGMRRGEILKLKWEDVVFKKGYIYVEETKNDESRAIPMPDMLKEVLLELRENKSEYVFQRFKDQSLTSFYP